MGFHADLMAELNGVERQAQDDWALASHQKAAQAVAAGLVAEEIAPVAIPGAQGGECAADDLIRPVRDLGHSLHQTLTSWRPSHASFNKGMSMDKIKKLGPVFRTPEDDAGRGVDSGVPAGTVTAASSSALTDGASAVLVMSEAKAARLGYATDIVIRSYAKSAIDPYPQLLLAPAVAVPQALEKAGLTLADIDIFEIHEAFSAQVRQPPVVTLYLPSNKSTTDPTQVLATIKCLASPDFAREFLGRTDGSCVGVVPLDRVNPHGRCRAHTRCRPAHRRRLRRLCCLLPPPLLHLLDNSMHSAQHLITRCHFSCLKEITD
jgi:acetyl-CoA acyltransferase